MNSPIIGALLSQAPDEFVGYVALKGALQEIIEINDVICWGELARSTIL